MPEQVPIRTAPRKRDEAVAILDPTTDLWSFSTPTDSTWNVAPASAGAEVLQRIVRAPGASHYTIWRLVLRGESSRGVTPLAQGAAGQPVSSRVAVALRRMSALRTGQATRAGLIANGGQRPAAEAPIRLQPTVPEVEAVPPSAPAPFVDGEPVTPEEAPPVPGEPLAMGPSAATVFTPQGPGVLGLGLLAAGGWWAWKKWGPKKPRKGKGR